MERKFTDKEDELEDTEVRGEAIYGDTDLDPNRDDQADAHHATEDEHL
jgi:hypothetical protein